MMVFLTHPHHKYTQDFRWLLEALGQPFTRIHGDRKTLGEFLPSLPHSPPKLLVLFQLEHLASWCSLFCPVIVFPMNDCTRGTPDSFLRALGRVQWVSFSGRLHQRLSSLGLACRHFRYAPDPDKLPEITWNRGVRGYFWERTPEHLDRAAAMEIFQRIGVRDFEIRSLEDESFSEGSSSGRRGDAEKAWRNHASYLEHLRNFQVYLAPRRFEGLGMTFLEAMAMGMCVVAENQPTAEEYIEAGTHGILYRGDDQRIELPRSFSVEELAQMGKKARTHLRQLHREWGQSQPDLTGLVAHLLAQPYPQNPVIPTGLLEATLHFGECPERLWTMAGASPAVVYRSTRQRKNWDTWSGRLRNFMRHPREVLLRTLEKEAR